MKLGRRKFNHDCEISMASLIDVVFLLIIFFMTVSHMTMVQTIPIDLPEAENSQSEQIVDQSAILLVNITESGTVVIGDRKSEPSESKQLISEILEDFDMNPGELTLRVDRKVDWKIVRQVIAGCNELEIRDIKLRVIEKI